MSDLPLYDNADDVPAPLPRDAMRFETVTATPYADGRRVRLNFTFPPFIDRPSVDACVTNAHGQTVATMSLIEAMEQSFEFTLHLRGPEPQGEHVIDLTLFYLISDERPDERQVVAEQRVTFTIPSSAG